MLWTKTFIEWQGLEVKSNILYRDNTSTMKLEMNDKTNCGKRTRHFDIKRFWHKHSWEKRSNNWILSHWWMWAGFYTNPLVGNEFGTDKRKIMNNKSIQWESRCVLENKKYFVGLENEYVSTEKGMSQQKCYVPRKSKKGLAHSLKII